VSRKNNTPVVSSASSALDRFKMEVANELGINNYDQIDKGQLSSRQNGYVGGNMTKKIGSELQHKSEIPNHQYPGHIHKRTFNISLAVFRN
jgi:dsRNA-specific ribonuclease